MSIQVKKEDIEISLDGVKVHGILRLPPKANGIVIFAHGSGSGRFSPRNNFVAEKLAEAGLGSLLADLLTKEEEIDRKNVFDIELLSKRLIWAIKFVKKEPRVKNLSIGFFGASTGAAAALRAAADLKNEIKAVVSRGGRPDLAMEFLPKVEAPTLLIVGGDDDVVISLNQIAFKNLKSEKQIVIVPDAGHLFEEEGKLEEVADLAVKWFKKYLQ